MKSLKLLNDCNGTRKLTSPMLIHMCYNKLKTSVVRMAYRYHKHSIFHMHGYTMTRLSFSNCCIIHFKQTVTACFDCVRGRGTTFYFLHLLNFKVIHDYPWHDLSLQSREHKTTIILIYSFFFQIRHESVCIVLIICHTSHENHLTKTWNTSKAFQLRVKVINPDEHNGKIDCNIAQKRKHY